jgi:hypothetical protein
MASLKSLDWISLSKADSGFVFATTHSLSLFDRWDWIEEVVRQEFECFDDDDVDCAEDDDGREFVTVNGKQVVEIHNCYMRNNAAGSELTRRAAA